MSYIEELTLSKDYAIMGKTTSYKEVKKLIQEGQKRYRERYGGEGCYNASNQHPVDEFICSECGVIIRDCQRYEYDEDSDDWSCYEFVYRYCPMCGKRIGDKE